MHATLLHMYFNLMHIYIALLHIHIYLLHIYNSLFLCILIHESPLIAHLHQYCRFTAHIKTFGCFTAHLNIYRFHLDFSGSKYNLTFDL